MEIIAGALIAGPFLVAGWLRYRRHRHALEKLVAQRTTSRKVRVEHEP